MHDCHLLLLTQVLLNVRRCMSLHLPLRAASQNFLNLASDATLTAAFGINEQRRLLIAEQCVARASAALPGIAGNVGGA